MQNFGRENFDDSTCIRQNSSNFSTVKVLRYTVCTEVTRYTVIDIIIVSVVHHLYNVLLSTTMVI